VSKRNEKMQAECLLKNLKQRDHLGDLVYNEGIFSVDKQSEYVRWIQLALYKVNGDLL
jgi:hypothetical protein